MFGSQTTGSSTALIYIDQTTMHHIPEDKKTKYRKKDICRSKQVLNRPNKTKQYEMMWVKGSRRAFRITEGVL